MNRIYVIGIGTGVEKTDAIHDRIARHMSMSDKDLEIVPLASIDDVPREESPIVLVNDPETETLNRIGQLSLEIRRGNDTYAELDDKKMRKIERRQNREFRSKKDRRSHR